MSARHLTSMAFWTYMLKCADGHYYVGHSDDLEARVAAHQSGAIGGYTRCRRPVVLVWSEYFSKREEAIAAERQIKGWSRAKKQALIVGDWGLISRLARSRS
ncbi:GIY-YIG nuclease family protein [Parasphingorhabdus sp.]|uniref:GIY-YIG nuclease family protein n=1 Tax=Parasphingorhabdus sp. TaxID=2709688 RepID=UPI003001CEC6